MNNEILQKLTSRKFWIAIAAFLASLGAGISGFVSSNEALAVAGGICCVVSGAIYAACEAYVDGQSVKSSQTINQTTITASANDKDTVAKAISADKEI